LRVDPLVLYNQPNMKQSQAKNQAQGFTIVELIVIVVVIVILAIATAVSYTAISHNAKEQAVKTDAQTIATQLNKHKSKTGSYPANLSDLADTPGTQSTFQYTRTWTGTFCLTASLDGASAYVTSGNLDTIVGACAGHTLND